MEHAMSVSEIVRRDCRRKEDKRDERDRRRGRRLIRPREAWQRLGIGHTTFYQFVSDGRIRLVELSPRIKGVVEDELDDLINKLVEARDTVASR
jgi:predicted DNA-binding transcriptional regulator AlpA